MYKLKNKAWANHIKLSNLVEFMGLKHNLYLYPRKILKEVKIWDSLDQPIAIETMLESGQHTINERTIIIISLFKRGDYDYS